MKDTINSFIQEANKSVLGKDHEVKLALACFLTHGHLLIEDVPGVGKTTFAKTLAKLCGLSFARVQFTNDLMPADLLGMQIYSAKEEKFQMIPGPIFHQFILADELNRGTPKTQSSLLEAMEEKQVTLDGNTISLPEPFFVIATQNPRHQIGTHLLPESQLDRFMMKIKLGYPASDFEKQMLASDNHQEALQTTKPVFNDKSLIEAFKLTQEVHVAEEIYQYVLNLLHLSRTNNHFRGLSPRAGKDIIKASKAWAMIHHRKHVLPDDVQAILPATISHRLATLQGLSQSEELQLCQNLIQSVTVDGLI